MIRIGDGMRDCKIVIVGTRIVGKIARGQDGES